jgi:hypothetical protein
LLFNEFLEASAAEATESPAQVLIPRLVHRSGYFPG